MTETDPLGSPRRASAAPLVSVVIPVRNRPARLLDAVASVRSQTLGNLEIVVVDDGSTDDTVAAARRLTEEEPRLRIVELGESHGAQAARNAGIKAARGEWLAFLDSDDVWYPDSLERRMAEARSNGVAVVHSDCDAVVGDDPVPSPVRGVSGDARVQLLAGPGPMFQGLLARAELFPRIGYLDEAVPSYQEWDSAIRLSAVARFGFVAAPTFRYDRGTPGAISASASRAAKGYSYVVRRHRREIVREAGLAVLGEHYRQIALMRAEAREWLAALRAVACAQLVWPLAPRRNARTLKGIGRAMRKGRTAS